MSIMLRCMHAHFSLAQAMRDPVTYEFIVGVDNLNIFHHLIQFSCLQRATNE